MNPVYIYLHGFASSPRSTKAQYLRDRFSRHDLSLHCLDFNQDNFSNLTLTRQIKQVQAELSLVRHPTVLIGSSLGGLTAAWVAESTPQVERLILLAPAFQFLEHWLPKLGPETLQQWYERGFMPVYHYGEQCMRPLGYTFVSDIQQYREASMQRSVPTLILHGQHDETIPIQASQTFAAWRPWVKFIELNGDHALTHVLPELWHAIQEFCQL